MYRMKIGICVYFLGKWALNCVPDLLDIAVLHIVRLRTRMYNLHYVQSTLNIMISRLKVMISRCNVIISRFNVIISRFKLMNSRLTVTVMILRLDNDFETYGNDFENCMMHRGVYCET